MAGRPARGGGAVRGRRPIAAALTTAGRTRTVRTRWTVAVAAMAVLTAACGGSAYTVPALTEAPTTERHVGKWVWYDLLTHDPAAAATFYGELFGWDFDTGESDTDQFTAIRHQGRAIGGMFEVDELEDHVSRARWVPYVSVTDVDRAVSRVRGLGGAVHVEPRDLDDRGRIAVVGDPQEAIFGLVDSPVGDPPDQDTPPGRFLWTELWTHDVQAAVDFYHTLAGYEHVVVDFPGAGDYDVLQAEGRPRAGVVKLPWEEVMPNWLPYVLVDDPGALADRVEALGGRVLIPPSESLRQGSVAVIADPSGAALTIQKWPPEGESARGFPQ